MGKKLAPQPGMQTKFIEYEDVYEIFTGGMAGPGKSWILLYAEILSVIRWPHLRSLFLRRKTPELAELIQEAHGMYSGPPLHAKFYSKHSKYQRAAFQFPKFKFTEDECGRITKFEAIPGTVGALLVFGHMKEENTKFDYGGFQFPHIRWDELCNFTESQYLFLLSRNRSKVDPDDPSFYIPPNVRSTGNPVGDGRGWVKRRFIEPMEVEEVGAFKRVEGRDSRFPIGTRRTKTRMFIPGDRRDNKYVGEDYEDTLDQLGEADHKALALGDWSDYDSDNQLIKSAWLEFALAGKDINPCPVEFRNQRALGADAAYLGNDSSVLCNGLENKPTKIWGYPQTSGIDLAFLVDQECISYPSIRIIALDSVGIGVSAADTLESGGKELVLQMPGMRDINVNINPRGHMLYRCATKDADWEEKFHGAHKFLNFRSQCYWKLREDMEYGNIDLSELVRQAAEEKAVAGDGLSHGDNLNMLKEELLAIHFYVNDNGYIVIQSKAELRKPENLNRSPDRADAFAYWNWGREREATGNVPGSERMHPAELAEKREGGGRGSEVDYAPVL